MICRKLSNTTPPSNALSKKLSLDGVFLTRPRHRYQQGRASTAGAGQPLVTRTRGAAPSYRNLLGRWAPVVHVDVVVGPDLNRVVLRNARGRGRPLHGGDSVPRVRGALIDLALGHHLAVGR